MANATDPQILNQLKYLFQQGGSDYNDPRMAAQAKTAAEQTNQYNVSQADMARVLGVGQNDVDQFMKTYHLDPTQYFGNDKSKVPGTAEYNAAQARSSYDANLAGSTAPADVITNRLNDAIKAAGPAPTLTTPDKFSFEADPGYAFRQKQGNEAVNAAAAARGGFFSGRAMKELDDFNSGLASQEYGNAYNRYLTGNADTRATQGQQYSQYADKVNTSLGASTQGLNTAIGLDNTSYQRWLDNWNMNQGVDNTNYNRLAGVANAGQTASSGVQPSTGQYTVGAGNAQASGAINSYNATAGAVNNGLGYYAYTQNPYASKAVYGGAKDPNFG